MKHFTSRLTAVVNGKGVLDVDTVKGCRCGMLSTAAGGCYGLCYAAKLAALCGYDFATSVSRTPRVDDVHAITAKVSRHDAGWFRIGTMGDPSHDWPLTAYVAKWLGRYRAPVIVTKHWFDALDGQLDTLAAAGATLHTSVSALDRSQPLAHKLVQHGRARARGVNTLLRVVSARFGDTRWGVVKRKLQASLFAHCATIDTPLRIPSNDRRVVDGHILASKVNDLNATRSISVARADAYIGACRDCPDQCGVTETKYERELQWQPALLAV